MERNYLVAVEWPCDWSTEERHLIVVVTDDVEGFGPGVMATVDNRDVPISKVRGSDLKQIALDYIATHDLEDKIARIQVNVPEDFREWEWRTEPGWALVE